MSVDVGWQRLDRRMLVVHPAVDLAKLVPVLLVIAITGGSSDDRWRLGGGIALGVAVLAFGISRWFTTSYRIGTDRVELRTGLLRRHHRSVHRDRIRTADLTANPAHRLFGLAVVRVGTGRREGGDDAELTLDAVRRVEAERLRALLLGEAPADADAPVPELARLRWTWVRFAPLTFSAIAVVGVVWLGLFRLAEEFSLRAPVTETLREGAGRAPVWLGAVALLATAVFGAAVVFVEGWWGYRLTRADDGGLVLRRGLLTRRTLSLEGRRLRGVELDEPLLVRLGRGARPLALTTGLRADGQGEHVGAVGPAMPRRKAHQVAAGVLGVGEEEGTRAPLVRHPRAAVVRRLTRGVGPVLVVCAALLVRPEAPGRPRRRPDPARRLRAARRRPDPVAGPRAHRHAPRQPSRRLGAAHRRPAPWRGDRLAAHPVADPAPRRARHPARGDRRRARSLRGARRRRRPRPRAGRGHHPRPAGTLRDRRSGSRAARAPLRSSG